jgi:hypothetical protein
MNYLQKARKRGISDMSVYPQTPPLYRTRPPAVAWADLDALVSFAAEHEAAFVRHLAERGEKMPRGRARQIRRRAVAVLDREL